MSHPEPRRSTTGNGSAATRIDRIDARARIVAAVVFSIFLASAMRPATLWVALAVTVVGLVTSGVSLGWLLRRLIPLNLLLLAVLAILPFSVEGTPLYQVGPLSYSIEGVGKVGLIGLKSNTIIITLLTLLGSIDPSTLGHALAHLRVPQKLIHLFLFTVRYLEVLQREHRRLVDAMRLRGFRPSMSRHAYRTYGHLAGMMLVRSLDRSERVMGAMQCRGFRGRYYLLDRLAFARVDGLFAVGITILFAALVLLEWL